MFFNDLRRHGKLAAKRHPMYEKNRFGKFFMYFTAVFWAGYLIFIGTGLVYVFRDSFPNMEPYHILNKALFAILFMDFLMRFPFQKTPTQEVKPYLLIPIKKNRVLDFLLLRSGLSSFNIIWLFLFVPFAILAVMHFFGITGIITYSLGIYLLAVFNNYWYLLCRTLLNERMWWIVLPVAVYGILAALEFVPDNHPITTFTMNLGEAFIVGNILAFLGVLILIALIWLVNRHIIKRLVYSEINKVEDTKVKHVSEYSFLERYGEIGEFFRLELKMLTRNKRCKMSLRIFSLIVVLFSVLLSFSTIYDNAIMKNFITIYSFVIFGVGFLSQIMSFEGSYLDGLMTRKESIYNLLKAKYYLYGISVLIPFVLMIPTMVTGKLSVFSAISYMFFSVGVVYFALFQLAVYNNKTVSLNEGISGRQNTSTAYQSLIATGALFLPVVLCQLLGTFFGENTTRWIMFILGLAFVLTAHLWIKNIYVRFMKRRYENMEGFRNTR
jgi:MFS family permease